MMYSFSCVLWAIFWSFSLLFLGKTCVNGTLRWMDFEAQADWDDDRIWSDIRTNPTSSISWND